MKLLESEIKKISELSALTNQNNTGLKQKFESVIKFISKLDGIIYNQQSIKKEDNLLLDTKNKKKIYNSLLENIKHKKTNNGINIKSSI